MEVYCEAGHSAESWHGVLRSTFKRRFFALADGSVKRMQSGINHLHHEKVRRVPKGV